jgi:hypothetical protein
MPIPGSRPAAERLRVVAALGLAASLMTLGGRAGAQLVTPTSHSGGLPGQPTASMLLGDHVDQVRGWWTTSAHSVQTTWRNSINTRANASLTLSQPGDFSAAATQSQIVQARAFRWLMNPQAATAATDLASVVDVLSNFARVTGGTTLTRPELVQNYYQAFDFINAGLTAEQRAAITSRLSGSNVKGTITGGILNANEPTQINNQRLKHASTRALGALLFNDASDLDTQLARINSSLAANSTDDGGYTDGLRYLNYGIAQFAPFAVAYANHTGVSLGPQVEQFVRMGLGMRLPNGTTPSAHNNDNAPVAISQFSRLITDPELKAAAVWNTTAIAGHDWTSWTNVVNNDWTYTDFFALTDFSVAPAAPNWSPTYMSGGQAQVATFRNDWGTTSHMINLSAGIDGASIAGFVHHDTGGLTVAAHGTQVLVEPGYNRTGLTTTPSGFNSSLATEHNVLLARDHGTTTWGIGSGTAQTNVGTTVTTTNRLDSAERGDHKGVADFVTLRATYGGSTAGNDVQARRSMAMHNESETDGGYFVVADSARRTDATNKDFAVNLIGKSTAANTEILSASTTLVQLRWAVNSYAGDGFNGGQTINGVPYNRPQSGQVVAHIVASGNADLSVAHDTTWMKENYDRYLQTQRMRVSAANLAEVAFLTIVEPGVFGAAVRFDVVPLSGPGFAAARITTVDDDWIDWVLSQVSASDVHAVAAGNLVSIDGGALSSDAQYAYVRRTGATLHSAMMSRGTSLATTAGPLLEWSHPVTASLLFGTDADPVLRGTLSGDDLMADTVLTLFTANLLDGHEIVSATLGGESLAFSNAGTFSTVTLAGAEGGQFVITFAPVPEPAAAVLAGGAALALLARGVIRRLRGRRRRA